MKCFYHSADLDGHCSGAIIKKRYPECEMIGINYGDDFPWDTIGKDETIFMVDFSLQPFEDMVRLADMCNFIWIDHHISAMTECVKHEGFKGRAFVNDDFSGCELTWMFFYSTKETPLSVHLLGRYDVWDLKADTRVMPFQWGMRIYDTLPEADIWDEVLKPDSDMKYIVKDGELLLEHRDAENEKYIKACAFETVFEGLRAIAVNKGLTNSQLFDSIWDTDKHDIMLTFVYRKGQWTVSLYTTKPDIDVSEIAKKYGGGGHRQAAGFQCEIIPFLR